MSDTTKQQKLKEALESKLSRYFGVAADDASKEQVYKAVILTVKDMLTSGRSSYRKAMKRKRQSAFTTFAWNFL
jgi:glucan phosphorylase